MNFSGMLLDSDVLAEIRKADPDPAVVAFLRRRSFRHMYISVLSIGELKGLYPYPETDRWITELLERFGDHVIKCGCACEPRVGRSSGRRSVRMLWVVMMPVRCLPPP